MMKDREKFKEGLEVLRIALNLDKKFPECKKISYIAKQVKRHPATLYQFRRDMINISEETYDRLIKYFRENERNRLIYAAAVVRVLIKE